MHELSLAQSLMEQVETAALAENAVRIRKVVVVIGSLSGVEASAFEFAFPVAAEGTMAEHAELVIEEVPARAHCEECGANYVPAPMQLQCPKCAGSKVSLLGGREFLVRSLYLDIPD